MGKKRFLDRKIRASQSFGALTYRQRDLWQGLITVVDDQGRVPGSAAFVRSEVWPFDDIPLEEVEEDLRRLEQTEGDDCGFIIRYAVGSSTYLQIVKWWEYQPGQWAMHSDFPPPPAWADRERYNGPGQKIVTKNWKGVGGFPAGRTKPKVDGQPIGGGKDVCDSDSVSDSDSDSVSESDDDSSSAEVFKLHMAMYRITGQAPTTEQVETLWEAGGTEDRAMAWYKDQQHGWPSIRPSNAERPDPWLSQVMEHLPNYRTHAERLSDSMDAHGVEH